jgi:hypothetical protein
VVGVILPYGGESDPDLVDVFARMPAEVFAIPEPPPREWRLPDLACTSRAGVRRSKHAPDKDGRCVFRDRRVRRRN